MYNLIDLLNSNGLNVNCWNRGQKRYKIEKISKKGDIILIKINNDDSIKIELIDSNYSVFINKKLVYKNDNISYDWIRDLYLDYLTNKGAKLI